MKKYVLALIMVIALAGQAFAYGWDAKVSNQPGVTRVLAQSAVAVPLTGTLVETTMATITIPGDTIGLNGAIAVTAFWTNNNSGTLKTLKIKLGGTQFNSQACTTNTIAQTRTIIRNRNSAAVQTAFGIGAQTYTNTTGAPTTGTVNTAASADITITGTLASTGDTITLEGYTVELLPGVN